jgi:hypothetical protein
MTMEPHAGVKEVEEDDPMELVGVALPVEDVDGMTDAVIQEYLFMGWSLKQVLHIFQSPAFNMTHQILHDRGEEYVRSRIRLVVERLSHGWLRGGGQNG